MSSCQRIARVSQHQRALVVGVASLVLVSFGWLAPPSASAQDAGKPAFFQVPSKLAGNATAIKDLAQLKLRVIKGQVQLTEQEPEITKWYNSHFFPMFTQLSELGKLPEMRQEVLRDLRLTRSKAMHDYVVTKTFTFMKNVLQRKEFNFHPAVRYNAMLLLGDLNEREVTVKLKVPVPYKDALPIMLAEFGSPDQSDAVRIAAQLGILRHAKLNWAPDGPHMSNAARSAIVRAMTPLVLAKDPPAGRSPEGHVWMQRRAIEILAAVGAVGPVAQVNQAIAAIVADETADVSLRCTAAATLRHIVAPAQGQVAIDLSDTSQKLGALAAYVCRRELDRVEEEKQLEEEKKNADHGPVTGYVGSDGGYDGFSMGNEGDEGDEDEEMMDYGDMGMGYSGGASNAPADPAVDRARRRFKYQLVCVNSGLGRIKELAAAGPDQAKVDEVDQRLQEVMSATDPPPEDETAVVQPAFTLDSMVEAIEGAVKKLERVVRVATPSTVPDGIDTEPAADVPSPVSATPADTSKPAADTPVPDTP